MSHLICSMLKERTYHKNVIEFTFVSGHTLNGSAIDESVCAMKKGKYYWVAFDSETNTIESQLSISTGDKQKLQAQIKNIKNSTNNLFESMDKLSLSEKAEFMHAVGLTVSGAWTVVNGIQTVNALFAWEPVNLCIGAVLTAGGALVAANQYESLNEQQKKTAEYFKAFNNDLIVYQTTMQRYKPSEYSELALDDPRFTRIISRLRRALPSVNLSRFFAPNTSFA